MEPLFHVSKSAHMRAVHACGGFEWLRSGYALDHRGALRCLIEPGEGVLPWAMHVPRPLDGLDAVAEAVPLVMPCALSMHSAARPCTRRGAWTLGREPPPAKPGR